MTMVRTVRKPIWRRIVLPLAVTLFIMGLVPLALWQHVWAGGALIDQPEQKATHRIEAGDSLFALANTYHVDRGSLAAANRLETNSILFKNQVLTIPADSPEAKRAAAGSSAAAQEDGEAAGDVTVTAQDTEDAAQAPGSQEREPQTPRTYTVQAGDSLFALAREFGVSQNALARANGLAPNAILYKNQVLTIPGDDHGPAMTPEDAAAEDAEIQDDASTDAGDEEAMGDDETADGDTAVGDDRADEESGADGVDRESAADETDGVQMDEAPADIVAALEDAGDFSTLVMVLEEAGLADQIRAEGPFTLFAPTDAVFEALPQNTLDTLLANPELVLTQILHYHIVPEELPSDEISEGLTVETLQGSVLSFSQTSEGTTVNGVPIVRADIEAGNGLIHAINAILIPTGNVPATATPEPAEDEETPQAATPEATATVTSTVTATATATATATPEEVEEPAVGEMDGESGMDDGDVDAGDSAAGEEEAAGEDTQDGEEESTVEGLDDIITTLESAGDFQTLLATLEATGLAQDLQGEGPFTLFAPTDDAFDALSTETFEALLADPGGDLTQILLYHVVPGDLLDEHITDGLAVETLQGSELTFAAGDVNPTVEGVDILLTDIETSNGVIHVIDVVLSPPAVE